MTETVLKALEEAREEVCKTTHNLTVGYKLDGFDFAAEAVLEALGHAQTPAEQMLDVACVLLWRWNNIAKNGDYGVKSAHPLKRHPLVDETDTFLDNNRTVTDTSTGGNSK